jgi:hypothetical protein
MTDSHLAARTMSCIASSCAIAGLVACALLAAPTLAQAAGSIKAAYVEEVIPAKTYAGTVFLTSGSKVAGPGAGAGVLGISSITLTNYDASAQQVFIYTPVFSNPSDGCNGTVVGGTSPQRTVIVQGKSTLHLPFPTPLVVNPVSGNTCIAAEVTTTHTGAVEVNFVGVLN